MMRMQLLEKFSEERDLIRDAWARYEYTVQGKSRIFILDDDHSIVNFISRLLETEEHLEVRGFSDELEAIKEFLKEKPDLLIIDVNLKTIDGVKVARILSEIPGCQVPIVFISSSNLGEPEFLHQFCRTIFVQKPLRPRQFLNQVKLILK